VQIEQEFAALEDAIEGAEAAFEAEAAALDNLLLLAGAAAAAEPAAIIEVVQEDEQQHQQQQQRMQQLEMQLHEQHHLLQVDANNVDVCCSAYFIYCCLTCKVHNRY
jgi:hypothetical protein